MFPGFKLPCATRRPCIAASARASDFTTFHEKVPGCSASAACKVRGSGPATRGMTQNARAASKSASFTCMTQAGQPPVSSRAVIFPSKDREIAASSNTFTAHSVPAASVAS